MVNGGHEWAGQTAFWMRTGSGRTMPDLTGARYARDAWALTRLSEEPEMSLV